MQCMTPWLQAHGSCNFAIVSIPDTASCLRQQHQPLQAIALRSWSQFCVFQVTLSRCEHQLCLDCFSTLCQQQSKPPLCPLCRGSITAIKAAASAWGIAHIQDWLCFEALSVDWRHLVPHSWHQKQNWVVSFWSQQLWCLGSQLSTLAYVLSSENLLLMCGSTHKLNIYGVLIWYGVLAFRIDIPSCNNAILVVMSNKIRHNVSASKVHSLLPFQRKSTCALQAEMGWILHTCHWHSWTAATCRHNTENHTTATAHAWLYLWIDWQCAHVFCTCILQVINKLEKYRWSSSNWDTVSMLGFRLSGHIMLL